MENVDDKRPGSKPPAGDRPAPAATPHEYIPPGPIEVAPYEGYREPEVRREALAAVLQGVPMGAYDRRIVDWLAGWDDTTCRTIASLMYRCRQAELADICAAGPPVPGPVTLTAAEAATVRQALADASAWRTWRTEGDRDTDTELATAYESLLRRLVAGQERR